MARVAPESFTGCSKDSSAPGARSQRLGPKRAPGHDHSKNAQLCPGRAEPPASIPRPPVAHGPFGNDVAASPDEERFFNEARAANAIDHPGIVRVFDSGYMPSGAAYLAMEFLNGVSLRSRFERAPRLTPSEVMHIGRQVAAALHAAHRAGVIHRDLKPEQVILLFLDGNAALLFRCGTVQERLAAGCGLHQAARDFGSELGFESCQLA